MTWCVQITDHAQLVRTLERFLVEYNSSSNKPMGLVFFQDAVDHIASIARVLRQPRGNALLVGVSGSGKQSLTRFAAALEGFTCMQLEPTKAYSLTDFREDLKVLSGLILFCILYCFGAAMQQLSAVLCIWSIPIAVLRAACELAQGIRMPGCDCSQCGLSVVVLQREHSCSAVAEVLQ